MEIKQLRYFVKVAELSSVGKASDFLNIAQPTLSRQIRALEIELKTNLFSRDGRGVQLTPRGRRFLEHARGLLHAADTAMDAIDEGKSVYEGKVIVGMTPSIGHRIIPDYISRFTERFPRASLSIVEGYSQALAEQVVMGKLDFALLLNPQASPNLLIDPVGPEVLYLIGAKPAGDNSDYVNLSDIGGIPLIMPHTIHTIRPLVEYEAARLGVMLNIAFEIDSVRSISALVQKGRGHTVMPLNSMRDPEVKGLHWQKIANPEIAVTICLIQPALGRRPHCLLKRRVSQRQPCLICWSCRLKKSRAIDLTHPSTLPHAGGNEFGGLPDRFARAEARFGMISRRHLFKDTFGLEMYLML
jgi:LysR family nitrogen assimilation transcriptional regulator